MLELRNISKIFPGVKALDDVTLSFQTGEIHALMGENGAGKSTLIKIIREFTRRIWEEFIWMGSRWR